MFISQFEDFEESSNLACFQMRKIGEGEFERVFEGEHRISGEKFAIKIVDGSKISIFFEKNDTKKFGKFVLRIFWYHFLQYFFKDNVKNVEHLFKEVNALKNLDHRNIVKIFNCYTLK